MARLLVDLMLEVKMQWISNRAAAAWSKARVGLEVAIPPVFLEPASPDAASSLALPCASGSLRCTSSKRSGQSAPLGVWRLLIGASEEPNFFRCETNASSGSDWTQPCSCCLLSAVCCAAALGSPHNQASPSQQLDLINFAPALAWATATGVGANPGSCKNNLPLRFPRGERAASAVEFSSEPHFHRSRFALRRATPASSTSSWPLFHPFHHPPFHPLPHLPPARSLLSPNPNTHPSLDSAAFALLSSAMTVLRAEHRCTATV